LLAFYALLQAYCIQQLSLNYDEPLFAAYGITVLKFQGKKDIQEFDSKLPITALNMLPRAAEQLTNPALSKSGMEADKDIINGRYISLIIFLLLGLLIFRWTSELYNDKVGICSLLLYLLCPDFLAHGIFVSSDIFACLFLLPLFIFCGNSDKVIILNILFSHHVALPLPKFQNSQCFISFSFSP
jgi:hypothetical protein